MKYRNTVAYLQFKYRVSHNKMTQLENHDISVVCSVRIFLRKTLLIHLAHNTA